MLVDATHGGAASPAGAGIASPQTFQDEDPRWHEFGVAAAAYLRELMARLREDGADPGPGAFAECGSLVLALAEHEDPWFEQVAALAMSRDPGITEISAAEAQALFPPLRRPWRSLLSPRSSRIDGRRLTNALHTALSTRTVPIIASEPGALSRRGDRVVEVSTSVGTIECEKIALAAGAWSAGLAAQIDVALPVTPTKGEIVHMVLPQVGESIHRSKGWPIVQPVLNFYLVPWPSGRVACGGTFDPGAGFDDRPTAGGVRDLLRECLVIAPGLAGAEVVETRVGLRPSTPDDRPLLGPLTGIANAQVCTGHGANGLLLGPYSAALVAADIIRGTTNPSLPYRADRFTSALPQDQQGCQ